LLMLANLMRFTRLNIICWEHYPFEKNSRIWQKIFKCLIFLNKKSVIVCNSTEEKKKFSFHNKIEVIPNSIKRTLYNQLYIEKEKLDLIYIGRIVKDKGVERLIDAIISFPGDKKHTLHIVGGGDELEYLKKKYAQIKEIIFYGPIINIEKFLEKNDVFVSGSYFECFPVTILEAMSHGLPIISMDTSGGTRSVISDSGGGYVCENKIEFHEKLSIFENSTVRAEHGKAGRSYVNKNYSDSIIGSKWIRLIENEFTMKSE
ncbi:glycosyl transferase family 1, partial [Salmonella enterica subsp. enterica serovar Wa]|nr:glycosyl transferase family 1 [Salmonella enterica subsp. enterica serovar Wa]